MNFDRSLIFSYLEEDNIQRAYFRVRPLLTLEGDVRQEAVQLWPNEGGLRIVPDRNEQHTFKVRMRTLGSYCVVDLRGQPPEAGKIRTNKNFRPDRGEVNQYILYSDTVHELPENTFYQMIDGTAENFAALAENAVTPLFYIRQEDTVYGPVRKAAPTIPAPAEEITGMLFEIPCPDGVSRVMLCVDNTPAASNPPSPDAAKPEQASEAEPTKESPAQKADGELTSVDQKSEETPAEETTPEALPIGETLQILDQSLRHEDTLKQLDKPVSAGANLLKQPESATSASLNSAPAASHEPLVGTPLVRTPLHVSPQQNKNKTQEVVSSQWSVGKYEPPVQNLPNGTTLHAVQNPVEAACNQLREAWNATSAHAQLTDFILSLDGIRPKLESKLCNGNSVTIMQRVLRDRLQDLEAERLTALCELDRARRDVDAYKQELLTGLAARIARDTDKLEADRKTAETFVNSLKDEINALTLQRDAILAKVQELQTNTLPEAVAKLVADAQMSAPMTGTPLRMSPVSGADADLEAMISRLMEACSSSGIELHRNNAIALLVLMAIAPRIGLSCSTPAPVATLIRNIASAFGWQNSFAHQIAAEQQPLIGLRPVDATPAVLMTSLPNYAPIVGATKLTLSRNTGNLIRNAAYDASQWPILMLPALPFVPELESNQEITAVSAASLEKIAAMKCAPATELDAVLGPVLNAATPLSGAARKELYRFVGICADLMEGGLPVAVDCGILLWVIPALDRASKQYTAVRALLDEYPLSLSKL